MSKKSRLQTFLVCFISAPSAIKKQQFWSPQLLCYKKGVDLISKTTVDRFECEHWSLPLTPLNLLVVAFGQQATQLLDSVIDVETPPPFN